MSSIFYQVAINQLYIKLSLKVRDSKCLNHLIKMKMATLILIFQYE